MKKRLSLFLKNLKYNIKVENSVNIYYFDNYKMPGFMSNSAQTMGSTPIYFTHQLMAFTRWI